jgi:hypothetical protein
VNEAVGRYIAGVLLCAIIALAYSATRKQGLRAILLDCVFCFTCMAAVVAAVAVTVHLLCTLK